MISEYCTGKTCGNADDEQSGVRLKDIGNDGDQDTKGSPRGTGGEAQQAGHQEDDGGQEAEERSCCRVHHASHEVLAAQKTGHVLQGSGKAQDGDGRYHVDESLGDAGHGIAEADDSAAQQVNDGEQQSDHGAPGQSHIGIGVCECIDEAGSIPESADIDQADDGEYDEDEDGKDQIQYAALLAVRLCCHFLIHTVTGGIKVAMLHGVLLMQFHGTVVKLHQHDGNDKDQSQQRIEVIRDGTNKQLDTVAAFHDAGDCCSPGRDGSDHADRSCRGIDDVGKLGSGDLMLIGNRTHDAANGKAVEIVVNKDDNTENKCGKHGTCTALDMSLGPASECRGTARAVDQCHHDPEDHEKQEDTGIVGDGCDQAIIDGGIQCFHRTPVGIEKCTEKHTDKQGGIDLLGDQGQDDCYQRRYQCPEREGHVAVAFQDAGASALSAFFAIEFTGTLTGGTGDVGHCAGSAVPVCKYGNGKHACNDEDEH